VLSVHHDGGVTTLPTCRSPLVLCSLRGAGHRLAVPAHDILVPLRQCANPANITVAAFDPLTTTLVCSPRPTFPPQRVIRAPRWPCAHPADCPVEECSSLTVTPLCPSRQVDGHCGPSVHRNSSVPGPPTVWTLQVGCSPCQQSGQPVAILVSAPRLLTGQVVLLHRLHCGHKVSCRLCDSGVFTPSTLLPPNIVRSARQRVPTLSTFRMRHVIPRHTRGVPAPSSCRSPHVIRLPRWPSASCTSVCHPLTATAVCLSH
jgi:hypothetical protein